MAPGRPGRFGETRRTTIPIIRHPWTLSHFMTRSIAVGGAAFLAYAFLQSPFLVVPHLHMKPISALRLAVGSRFGLVGWFLGGSPTARKPSNC
jgi:hypothetical protein